MQEGAITADHFRAWSEDAKPGDSIVYRTGRVINFDSMPTEGAVLAVRSAYNTGLYDLTQRRVGSIRGFPVREYIITRRKRPTPPVVPFPRKALLR